MKEFFEDQLIGRTYDIALITEQSLKERLGKTYFNGDAIKVGDVLLWAVLEKSIDDSEMIRELIALNESHFPLLEIVEPERIKLARRLPLVRLKK